MNPWAILAAVAAFVAYTWGVFYEGGASPRAEYAALIKSDKQAADARAHEDKIKQDETNATIATLEKEKNDALKNAADGWSAYSRMLNNVASNSPGGAKSIPVDAKVCNDPDADKRLSDAVQSFRVGVRAAVDRLEQSSGQLLERAGMQAVEANELKAFLQSGQRINGE